MKKDLCVMLDMSRNGVMTVPALKRYIDLTTEMGYTSMQLYTEDVYEIDGEPMFGYLRGAYTNAELKELDEYAFNKGMELVPAIQTLAHLGSIFRWSDYSKIHDIDDVLLADDERTYALIDKMFANMRACYRTNRINIGMDEAHHLGLGKYLDEHGFTDRSDIMLRHVKKVCEIAAKYNFKPMMWSDMFFRLAAGSYYSTNFDEATAEKVRSNIPENLTLIYWDYYSADEKRYDDMLAAHKRLSSDIAFAGGAWSWMGFAPHNDFSIKTMRASVKILNKRLIDRYIVTVWGDNGKECSYFSVLPALLCAAEFYNGNFSMKSIKEKFRAITGCSFDDFLKLDYPNLISESVSDFPSPCKYMLYNDPLYGVFDKTASAEGAEKYAKYASALSKAEKRSGEFAYLFRTLSDLCKLLSVKYDLGVRIRAAYKSGDKGAIAALLPDCKKTITRTEAFYEAFETQWYKECKPFGFEVQDARIGGVIQRLKHAKKRLDDYIQGKIDKIDELEAEVRPFDNDEKFNGKSICYNSWVLSFTTSPN